MPGPLAGLRVLELARILAGPWAGQVLADLGADVIKVERKGAGDDTRAWGPPFVEAEDGGHLGAAYFHATNRGKRSIEFDFESEDGKRIVKKLAARSDVLIENFKVGGLAKFGLDYKSLAPECPRLIYCSVTGFGQDGPYAPRAGYDLMAQGMGGFMSLTGTADGEPTRAGVPVSDIMTGIYSVIGILAALRAARAHRQGRLCRHRAGRYHGRRAGQPGAELSRLRQGAAADRQRASQHRALSGVPGGRRLHHHRHRQRQPVRQAVRRAGRAGAGEDPSYIDNKARLANRAELVGKLTALTDEVQDADLLDKLEAVGVPAGPINNLDQVFDDPHVKHRGMKLDLPSDDAKGGTIPGVRTPIVVDGRPMASRTPRAAARRAHRGNSEGDRRRLGVTEIGRPSSCGKILVGLSEQPPSFSRRDAPEFCGRCALENSPRARGTPGVRRNYPGFGMSPHRSGTAQPGRAAVQLSWKPQVRLLSSVPRAVFEVCSARPPVG